MFKSLKFWLFYSDYIQADKGIIKFADSRINKLAKKTIRKKSKIKTKLTESKETLKQVDKQIKNLKQDSNTLLKQDDYHSIKMKYRISFIALCLILVSEIFLNFISFKILIDGYGFFIDLMRFVLAIILTSVATIISEKFFEAVMPIQKYGIKKEKKWIEMKEFILYLVILLAISFIIFAISGKRASDIEGQAEGLVYWSFIWLSVILPIVGGLIWRVLLTYKDAYSNTRQFNKLNRKSSELRKKIAQLKTDYSNVVNYHLGKYWDELNQFKVYKENYNEKHGFESQLPEKHYATDYDEFKNEAINHYKRVESSNELE